MEMLDYPFMQSALLMGLVLGALFSLMGAFVVTRGMAFFGDFLSHSALLGGALALIIGAEPSVFLIIYCLAVGFAVSAVWQKMPLSRDTVLGVFYGGTVSIAILLMTGKGLGQQSLMQFLLGDILLIGSHDVLLASGLLLVFTAFGSMNRRRLVKASFLPEVAEAEGINVRGYELAIIALMSITIALSIKVVGVLLANAMVVIPAATAKSVSRNLRTFIVAAPLFGVFSFILGLSISFYMNLPSGPSIVATAFSLFIVTLPFRAR